MPFQFDPGDILVQGGTGFALGWVGGKVANSFGGRVTVFRVEGEPNTRLLIDANGKVTILGDNTLYLNFGDQARAEEFLAKRLSKGMETATIKSFQVPRSFLNELRSIAVPQSEAKAFPGRPVIVDITKAADQCGLRADQIEQLKCVIIQGTGR